MTPWSVSECGRFVVIDGLHVDRNVVEALARWATDHGLRIQDAIQLALCSFNARNGMDASVKAVFRVQDSRVPVPLDAPRSR